MHAVNLWKINNSQFLNHYTCQTQDGWGKISFGFEHKLENDNTLTTFYTFNVDFSNCDLYLKKSSLRIQAIFASMILIRPLHTIIKTFYHVFLPLSLPMEIAIAIHKEGKKSQSKSLEPHYFQASSLAAVKSIADIIRTPLYDLILTIISISATIVTLIKPDSLYEFRKLHGKIETSLNWGNNNRCLVRCFTPVDNLMKVDRRNRLNDAILACKLKAFYRPKQPFSKRVFDSIPYSHETSSSTIIGLTNLAYSIFDKSV